ncbi:MAG: hypothetical protein ACSHX7_04535 [Luteolibacter sp.]
MPENPPNNQHAIPESLRLQLEEFRKILWRRKVIEAVAAGLIGLLLSFLLIFGLDRIWQTPGWARLLILVSGVSLFAGFAPYWLHRWVWGHRSEGQLATLIAKRFPGLGDRLLGVIELQGQNEEGGSLSPRLRAAAMDVVALEAGKRDLEKALPAPRHLKWALGAIALMAIVIGAFLVTPKAGFNALERWAKPFSEVKRYTFTQLEGAPEYLAVPYGEAFQVSLKLADDSEQSPASGRARYESQPELEAKLRGGNYVFDFAGQQEEGVVTFRIGDLVHRVRVEPMQRPIVERTRVLVKSPDYLQIPDREIELSLGQLSAVEGSELFYEMEMSRPLKSGKYGPSFVSGEMSQEDTFEASEGEAVLAGNAMKAGPIKVGVVPFEIPFKWVDEFGLNGGSDFKLRVEASRDMVPLAYLQGLPRQKAILPEESLEFEILCEDDFGLKAAGIEWSGMGTIPGEEPTVTGELILAKGEPEKKRIIEPAVFSPEAFGLGPQRLVLRAFTEDYFPERGRVYSDPVLLYVLSREEHAQLLKSQFDRSISELEDLSRKELNLLDENQRLERLDGEELQKEENRKRIDAQEQAESENTQRMKELTERMEDVMKGAMRNGEIDKETLKKMAEAMKSMQELGEENMPEVRDELREAQERSNTAEKTKQDISEAVEKQKEVVEKIKEAVAKANDANERFEASTFVSRLKKAAADEGGIASALIAIFPKVLGMREEEVDPADQRGLGEATQKQASTASDVRWIQEDLGHYFARTANEAFKGILDKMVESKIDVGLEDVRSKLQQNHTYEATEGAKQWQVKLSEWANLLSDEISKSMSGGGEGGGPSPEDEDFEFMLRVMKMVQQEQDLRARTRVLEQLKRDAASSSENY